MAHSFRSVLVPLFTGLALQAEGLSTLARPTVGFLDLAEQVPQPPEEGPGSCVPLENRGTFAAVEIGVGEPRQKLSIVADTGSSAVIVASCECKGCGEVSSCYSSDQSSSFAAGSGNSVKMTFGSGDIIGTIVTDVVSVGAASVLMTDGLMEMLDTKLDFSIPIEGILGLGPPDQESKNFLTEAKITHFSMCLYDNGGSLQLGGPQGAAKKLENLGTVHWGLGFNGISVGDGDRSAMSFCSPFDMQPGQDTPCGAIPDSGTTMISAPQSHLIELMGGICDAWPRCAAAASRVHLLKSKAQIFMSKVSMCNDWIHEGEGLDELPTLHFHLTGKDGSEEPVALTPWSYIIEMPIHLYETHVHSLIGLAGKQPDHVKMSGPEMCAPAFGVLNMNTQSNGPIWILGTSLFYEYAVNYNLSPQTISFEPGSCGECHPGGAGSEGKEFVESGANDLAGRHNPRRMTTAPRLPERYNVRHGVL